MAGRKTVFIVNKKDFHSAYTLATKLVGKFTEVFLDVQKDGIWIIINVESYIKLFVPAEVEETGLLKIQQEVLQAIFSLRGDKLKCSFNREQNILNVSAGTKTSLYVSFKVYPEDIEEPEVESATNKIKIKSSAVGTLKDYMKIVAFTSPDINKHEYALMKNNADEMSLNFATPNQVTVYTFPNSISSKEFEITIPVDKLKMVLPILYTDSAIYITDNYMLIKSENIVVTLPALIDTQFIGFIEASESFTDDEHLMDGCLKLNIPDVKKALDSVRAISKGSGIINFKTKGDILYIDLENKIGTTKDKCKMEENTVQDDLKFSTPELFLDAALSMSSKVNNNIEMRFNDGLRYYVIFANKDDISFSTIGPTSEV